LRRIVTLEGHADDIMTCAQGVQNLRRRREQRHYPHDRTVIDRAGGVSASSVKAPTRPPGDPATSAPSNLAKATARHVE
jgi:hypothetical protein